MNEPIEPRHREAALQVIFPGMPLPTSNYSDWIAKGYEDDCHPIAARIAQALANAEAELARVRKELEELKGALEFLDVHCRVNLIGQARELPATAQNAIALATELGWSPPREQEPLR